MRHLGEVVAVTSGDMVHRRHDCPMRGTVTLELVGDQSERYRTLTLQGFAKEAHHCTPISARLHEDVNQVPVLIDGTPQILPLTVDRDKDFVQKPRIPETTPSSFQLPCVLGSEIKTPLSDGFVGNDDPALRDIPEAQAEPIVMPDGVANDFGRKTVSVVGGSAAQTLMT